jgi:hypothetical protein
LWAAKWPPWTSIMDRVIAKPMPIPSGLGLVKASGGS